MSWSGEYVGGRTLLDELAGIQDAHSVAHFRDDREVVADEQDRRSELGPESRHEVEDLCFDGGIERRRRLVEDEERGFGRERHGDDDALRHPAGQLVRVAPHDAGRVGDLHPRQHRLRSLQCFGTPSAGDFEDFGDLPAHADGWVQRPSRLLVHHRHRLGPHVSQGIAAHLMDVKSVDRDRSRADATVLREVPLDCNRQRGLAGTRLADEAVRFAATNAKRHVPDRQTLVAAHPVRDVDVIDDEGVGGIARRRSRIDVHFGHGHAVSADSTLSAIRLTAITSDAIARAGKSVSHQ